MAQLVALAKTPRLVIGMRGKTGFTLIEMLVVLLIIGTTVTFAMLSFGDFGKSKLAKTSAEQMMQYISLLQQKAILENKPIGISIHPSSYHAQKFVIRKGWQQINKSNVYREQMLPSGVFFYDKKSSNTVDIIVQPSGDISPFTLYLGNQSNPKIVQISSDSNGEVMIHATS